MGRTRTGSEARRTELEIVQGAGQHDSRDPKAYGEQCGINAEYVSKGLMKTLREMVGYSRRYDKTSLNYIFLLD
jgi:hypothetical protein